MDSVHPRFDTVYEAINFYRFSNPARGKSQTMPDVDPDAERSALRSRPPFYGDSFSGGSHEDHFASVIYALTYTFKVHNDRQMKAAFELYYLVAPTNRGRLSKEEVAKILGVSKGKVGKWLDTMLSTLERELIRRQVVKPLNTSLT